MGVFQSVDVVSTDSLLSYKLFLYFWVGCHGSIFHCIGLIAASGTKEW